MRLAELSSIWGTTEDTRSLGSARSEPQVLDGLQFISRDRKLYLLTGLQSSHNKMAAFARSTALCVPMLKLGTHLSTMVFENHVVHYVWESLHVSGLLYISVHTLVSGLLYISVHISASDLLCISVHISVSDLLYISVHISVSGLLCISVHISVSSLLHILCTFCKTKWSKTNKHSLIICRWLNSHKYIYELYMTIVVVYVIRMPSLRNLVLG